MIYALIGIYAWGAATSFLLLGTTVAHRFEDYVEVWRMVAAAILWPLLVPYIAVKSIAREVGR